MAFDDKNRNLLQKMVDSCRRLLSSEFTKQLQELYGIQPATGSVVDLSEMTHLTDDQYSIASLLRDRIEHLASGITGEKNPIGDAIERVIREQAFTILNRFAALRMSEEREIVRECVRKGMLSQGFQVYLQIAGSSLGDTYHRYRVFLGCLFDELAIDLGTLFDRYSPFGLLFPREQALNELLVVIDDPQLKDLWKEDETIGWIYQYFNTKVEREAMRKASQAPRNSRELAVRNQFFTPRYVVEFLTDNTLGRIWYEMTRGKTKLKEECNYFVRRPHEIFLGDPVQAHKRLWGKSEDNSIEMSELISNAFQGKLEDLPKHIDADTYWIALAIPPDQFEPYTGIPYEPLDSGPLDAIWDALEGKENKAVLDDVAWLWMALCHFRLTDSGSAYGHKPFEKLWQLFLEAIEKKKQVVEKSQEELLNEAVYIPYRPIKDPRTITMLDPACGSMHFGLYSFDLFETIYEEAWDSFPELLTDLREQVSSKEEFMNMVPEMIIRHNIHGIDIDPRATQIAEISLWLRAQKSYQRLKIKATDRPSITKSNIVCAEPMPGEKEMLGEFIAKLKPAVLGDLVWEVWQKMQLAGEAGSLLKIEEELTTAIEKAKEEWERYKAGDFEVDPVLFKEMEKPVQGRMRFDVTGVKKIEFWDNAETLVLSALRDFAESATNGHGYQRKLFAEDAVHGFAFIDLCRKKFDVVLMNPPFGALPSNPAVRNQFPPESGENLYAAFVIRWIDNLHSMGRLACITDRTFLLLPTYQNYRDLISGRLVGLADLDWGVLDDAQVATSAYIISASTDISHNKSWFIDARSSTNKADKILSDIQNYESVYVISSREIQAVPTHPLSYWAPQCFRKAFVEHKFFEPAYGIVRKGLSPGDSDRFVLLWWEVPDRDRGISNSWAPYANGGEFSPYCRPTKEIVKWADKGREIKGYCFSDGRPRYVIRSAEMYGIPGLTFGKRGDLLNVQVLPAGQVISNEGYLILPTGSEKELFAYLGFFNATPTRFIVNMICGLHKEVGAIKFVPVPSSLLSLHQSDIATWARKAYDLMRSIWDEEANPEFHLDSLILAVNSPSIKRFCKDWNRRRQNVCDLIDTEARKIDDAVSVIYSLASSGASNDEIINYKHLQSISHKECFCF